MSIRSLSSHLAAALWLAAASLWAQASTDSLKVLTYNTWHGTFRTEDSSILRFPSESDRHRQLRHRLQLSQLLEMRPDVLLLQEVNPLPARARQLAAALGFEEIHKVTDCGIKILGLGPPINVNSGLAILARPGLGLTAIAVERLSGRWAFCSDRFGLQVEEARYALMAQLTLENGDRYLLVSSHLHNAPEMSRAQREALGALQAEGRLSRNELRTIHRAVEQGQTRQRREVDRLISLIRRHTAEDPGLAGVIVGGDLNAGPDSEHLDRLRRAGLVDVVRAMDPPASLVTSDPLQNPLLTVLAQLAKPELPTFGRPALAELAVRLRPQQIDFLLVSRSLETAVQEVRRFGLEQGALPTDHAENAPYQLPLLGSDHFGLAVQLDLRRP